MERLYEVRDWCSRTIIDVNDGLSTIEQVESWLRDFVEDGTIEEKSSLYVHVYSTFEWTDDEGNYHCEVNQELGGWMSWLENGKLDFRPGNAHRIEYRGKAVVV